MTQVVIGGQQTQPLSHWGYGERSIVVDDEPAFEPVPPTPSEDVLAEVSLQESYRRACASLAVRPNAHILVQLPSTCSGRPHWSLQILDGSGAYLGSKGVAALIPVILACPRLTHLILPRVGLQVAVAKALIHALSIHPGITTIQLHQNHLGTAVGQQLLHLAQTHRRIHTIGLDETLIIPPLKRRIDNCLSRNAAMRDQFSVPKIPLTVDDHEMIIAAKVREAEERARLQRAEALRKEIDDRIPTWAPAVVSELRAALVKHQRSMSNVLSVFTPMTTGDGTTAALLRGIPCTVEQFQRGLRILGVVAPAVIDKGSALAAQQCRELAGLFGAYNVELDAICVGDLMATLRVHAVVVATDTTGSGERRDWMPLRDGCGGDSNFAAGAQRALDRLYDNRAAVAATLESLDHDQLFTARLSEIANGLASLTCNAPAVREILIQFLTSVGGSEAAAFSETSARHADGTADAGRMETSSSVAASMVVMTDSSGDDGSRILVKPELDVPIRYHLLLDALELDPTAVVVQGECTSGSNLAAPTLSTLDIIAIEQRRLHNVTKTQLRSLFPPV